MFQPVNCWCWNWSVWWCEHESSFGNRLKGSNEIFYNHMHIFKKRVFPAWRSHLRKLTGALSALEVSFWIFSASETMSPVGRLTVSAPKFSLSNIALKRSRCSDVKLSRHPFDNDEHSDGSPPFELSSFVVVSLGFCNVNASFFKKIFYYSDKRAASVCRGYLPH